MSRNHTSFFIGVAVMASVPLLTDSDYLLTVLVNIMFGIYLCVCWNLAFGFTGLFSLGHQAFLGIGAYASTLLYLNYQISPWLGMFVGGFVSTALAVILTFLCYRYRIRGLFFAIVTLAFGMLFQNLFITWDYARAAIGIYLRIQDAPLDYFFLDRAPYYWIMLAMVVMGLGVTYFIQKSHIGYCLNAIREDEDAAEAVGVPSSRYKVLVMAITAFMVSLAGTFYAQFYLYIHPDNVLSIHPAVTMQVGVMAGGGGTLLGPVVGWAFFGLFDEMLRWFPITSLAVASLSRITYGLVLMVIVIFFPEGLIGLFGKLGRMFKPPRAQPEGSPLEGPPMVDLPREG